MTIIWLWIHNLVIWLYDHNITFSSQLFFLSSKTHITETFYSNNTYFCIIFSLFIKYMHQIFVSAFLRIIFIKYVASKEKL